MASFGGDSSVGAVGAATPFVVTSAMYDGLNR